MQTAGGFDGIDEGSIVARPTEHGAGMAGHSPRPPSRRRSEEAFRRATRHSRVVRVLKWALPALGAVMAAAFVAQSYISSPDTVGMKVEGAAVSDGKLVMANPKLEGFTKDNLPYAMNAIRAVQDVTNEGVVLLEQIGARLPIDATNWATVDAAGGTFDRNKNTLALNTAVTITTQDGMVAKLKSAYLDMNGGSMKTSDPVDITVNGARITSDTMQIADNGKVLVFENRVKVNIDPTKQTKDK